jgi:hypothetical protein
MVQRSHNYTERNDWSEPLNTGNQDQSKWIWAALAALALAGLLVWMATSGGPQTSPVTNIQKLGEQSAPAVPAPAEPQIAPVQPAPVEPTPPGQTPQQQ